MLIFTRFSIFLTVAGIISISTPLCLAYFLFRMIFKVKSLGILSGISLFIIIGIGVDDVFVFINTFRQAHSARSLEARMTHTLCTAGKATFFTSFTTSAAFAANCLSQVRRITFSNVCNVVAFLNSLVHYGNKVTYIVPIDIPFSNNYCLVGQSMLVNECKSQISCTQTLILPTVTNKELI